MLDLTLRTVPDLPLELDGVIPSRLVGLSNRQIAQLPITQGNRTLELGQFFDVRGDCSYGEIHILGDCSRIQRIGEGLDFGRIVVEGSVGLHAGAKMTAGELVIHGQAGHWLGAELCGGRIRLLGNAGDHVGGAYVGSKFGQRGGEILIVGDAGHEAGVRMRRGLIAISGSAGRFAGLAMIAGSIVAVNGFGTGAGAGMKRGTLLTWTDSESSPGFAYSCTYQPSYTSLLLRQLRESSFTIAQHLEAPQVHCHRGDRLTGGRGEFLIAAH